MLVLDWNARKCVKFRTCNESGISWTLQVTLVTYLNVHADTNAYAGLPSLAEFAEAPLAAAPFPCRRPAPDSIISGARDHRPSGGNPYSGWLKLDKVLKINRLFLEFQQIITCRYDLMYACVPPDLVIRKLMASRESRPAKKVQHWQGYHHLPTAEMLPNQCFHF